MIRPGEIQPRPSDGFSSQLYDVHRLARASVLGRPGPGLVGMQTVYGHTSSVDPMLTLRQKWGTGYGASTAARWA